MMKDTKNHSSHDPRPKRTASYVFFSVLLLCLLAVGGVAVSTFSENLKNTVIVEESPAPSTTPSTVTTASPVAAVTATTTATTTASIAVTTTTAPPPAPLYACPLPGSMLTLFSETPQYNETMADHRVHRAIDFAGQVDDTVAAFSNGEVTETGHDLMLGDYVIIDHGNGLVSRYGGVKAKVAVGDIVKAGDAVGTVSAVPFEAHLEPHVHFEVTQNGQPIDPSPLWI